MRILKKIYFPILILLTLGLIAGCAGSTGPGLDAVNAVDTALSGAGMSGSGTTGENYNDDGVTGDLDVGNDAVDANIDFYEGDDFDYSEGTGNADGEIGVLGMWPPPAKCEKAQEGQEQDMVTCSYEGEIDIGSATIALAPVAIDSDEGLEVASIFEAAGDGVESVRCKSKPYRCTETEDGYFWIEIEEETSAVIAVNLWNDAEEEPEVLFQGLGDNPVFDLDETMIGSVLVLGDLDADDAAEETPGFSRKGLVQRPFRTLF